MISDATNDPVGAVRRAPDGQGLDVAICIMQRNGNAWHVVDAYGAWQTYRNEDVTDWPVIYTPRKDAA